MDLLYCHTGTFLKFNKIVLKHINMVPGSQKIINKLVFHLLDIVRGNQTVKLWLREVLGLVVLRIRSWLAVVQEEIRFLLASNC